MASVVPIALDIGFGMEKDFNQSSDPRVGSARDNGTTTSVLRVPTGSNSASGLALLMTILPALIYAAICILIFWVLRRKFPRVYAPRTFLSSLHINDRTPALPSGWFNWIKPFYDIPDSFVLNHSSLDGFLFLRFIKIVCVICFVGCCLLWPILLPLHACGGGTGEQLELLSFANVTNTRYYFVHAFLAWIYFGFVLYMVSRECVYFINLRQAYLSSPSYANRLSSRTVLFTCIPQKYLDAPKLRKVFGDTVKTVWIQSDTKNLDRLVKERSQTAMRLEKAEIKLIKMANVARNKALRRGQADLEVSVRSSSPEDSKEMNLLELPESPRSPLSPATSHTDGSSSPQKNLHYVDGPLPDVRGSVAAQWIPYESRPTHRPIANYGRKVDTIKWTRNRLKELAPQIHKLKRKIRKGKGDPLPAAFIEFESQVDAQAAYQTLSHHRAFHMTPHIVGLRPQEIIWESLRMRWWERITRRFLIQGIVAVMVVFWSIPCALVGIVSNVNFLATTVPFLGWLLDLPEAVLGFITGLLPAVALTFLMAIVPAIMRVCARAAGAPTESMVELFVQNSYFVFQVVQVFLVTTLTSAASAAFSEILENPMSIRTLLSANLPKASNFYISYFIIQGLALGATGIVHLGSMVRHEAMKNSSDNPRFVSTRYHRLRKIHWGSRFPVFTNMGVIAITYSCIAPIILGFAVVGLLVVYAAYRYNLFYVYDSEIDTRGLHYPRALKQLLTGVYLAEICMIGLFSIAGAFVPVVLMIMLAVFTALVHISLNDALGPLLYNLPRTLATDHNHQRPEDDSQPIDDIQMINNMALADIELPGDISDSDEVLPVDTGPLTGPQTTRAIEGADTTAAFLHLTLREKISAKLESKLQLSSNIAKVDFWSHWISPSPEIEPNFLLKWLHPEIFSDYTILRNLIPRDLPEPEYRDEVARNAYHPPNVLLPPPKLWIPRDPAGVSTQEVSHTEGVINITDEGAVLDERGRLVVDLEFQSPVLVESVKY